MIKRFLLPIILSLVLAMPVCPGMTPGKAPVPGKGQASSTQGSQSPLTIVTAPKGVTQTKVGPKGEIEVPRADAVGPAANSGPGTSIYMAAQGPGPDLGTPAIPATSPDDSGDANSTDKGDGDAGAPSATTGPGSGDFSTPGSTGADARTGSGGLSGNSGAVDPAMLGGVPTFLGETPATVANTSTNTANISTSTANTSTITTITFPSDGLQALLDRSVSDTGVPGAVMAVQTQAGTWIGASGKADLPANQAMTSDMQVRLAGVTELFTAALIMKLVEETIGNSPETKLSLDDTIDKWLPDWAVWIQSSSQITVRMLLNHTSGLHDYETSQDFLDVLYYGDPTYPWTSDDIFYFIYPYPLDFEPGTQFSYTNTGYYLLGMIAEAVAGNTADPDPLKNMIQSRFFGPLGLTRTALTRGGLMTAPYTRYYSWFGIPLWNQTEPTLTDTSTWDFSFAWTSGSGVSTAQDMLTWTTALFGDKVVNSQSLQQMTTPQAPATSYGFGLQVMDADPWFSEKMYVNGSAEFGVLTRWLYYPNSGRTIFLALNRADNAATTDPAYIDAVQLADSMLSGASTILINADAQ